jgi:thioredoxin reductase
MNANYDVVVVGGGAAGLAGAVALARSRRSVLVVDSGEPRNAPASHVHNFLTRDGTPPAEIYAAGREEVTKYGGQVVTGRVTALSRDDGHFRVRVGTREVTARRLLMANGLPAHRHPRDRSGCGPPGAAVPPAQPARDGAAAHGA